MASVGVIDTTKLRLYVDGAVVDCEVSSQVDVSRETKKLVCKDNPTGTKKYGEIDWNMQIEGLLKTDATQGGYDLLQLLLDGTTATALWATDETGDKGLQGTVLVSNWSGGSSGVGEGATFSATLEGSGDLSIVTV